MYSKAASLNSVTEQGATAFNKLQTFRVLTTSISDRQETKILNDGTYQSDQVFSGKFAPAYLS